ncbi:MAG: outer membrane lipoprotein chaperone LolA [Steroidobacteraceae bacterium]
MRSQSRISRRLGLRLVAAALLLPAMHLVAADVATPLDRYLDDLRTWSATFRQSVTDAKGRQMQDGEGRLIIVRPGRFRWESTPAGADPGAQLLVADGRNLWFYDRDLQQVTVRALSDALPQSPAMLLAGGAELRSAFDVRSTGRREGLDWVQVLPRDPASDFREALFGFQGTQLARMVVLDRLGQRSQLQFMQVQRNQPVDPALVTFEPPAGADVIGTARP